MTVNKKWAALGAVVLALGVGAAVFMQQTSARVEAEVRAALAGLPGLTEHSVDRVSYDFFTQTLTLKNVHLVYKGKNDTTNVTLGEVLAVKPNPHALKGGEAGKPLAEEVRVSQYVVSATTATPPSQAESRMDSMRITRPQADIPGLLNLATVNGKPLDAAKGLKALDSLKAASLNYTGLTLSVTAPEVPTLRMSVDSIDARDLTCTYTGSATFKNWVVDVQNMGKVTLGTLEVSAMTLPDLSKIPPSLLSAEVLAGNPSEADATALLDALEKSIPRDKPMLGKLILQDVKESFSGGNVSLQRLSVDNFWYEPRQIGLTLEGLSMPSQLIPTPVIGMLGYERLNMSGDLSLRPLTDKVARLATSLDVQNAGKVQLCIDVKGDLPAPTDSFEDVSKLLLESLKLTYLDKGLAGRGMLLAQSTMNWGPDMVTGLIRASAADIVGNDPEAIKQFMNFVEKPGELIISIKPTKPMTIGQMKKELTPADTHVTSVPGPKTLKELARP